MSADNDYVATEALFLDKDGKVVKHNDPAKAVKLADVGHRIPYERALSLGLVEVAKEAEIEEATDEDVADDSTPAEAAKPKAKAPARKK